MSSGVLSRRRTSRKSRWLPWIALTVGTAASLAANVATADRGVVSRIIAGWPAIALLIAVKLLSGMLEHRNTFISPLVAHSGERFGDTGPVTAVPCGAASDADNNAAIDSTSRTGRSPAADGRRQQPARPIADVHDLLPAARAVQDDVRTQSHPLTRDALAVRLRTAGHRVGNDRLTPLPAALRDTPAT